MTDKVKKVMKASFWLLAISWSSRVLSMFTVIILARNLDKHDFGILAGCFVVQGFFSAIAGMGSSNYLLRKKTIGADDINAAWTINFFSRMLMALLIFLLSDQAANFMRIPEIGLALKVMCLSVVFKSFLNPAINIKIKQLDYSKIALLEVSSKFASTLVSIAIILVYQSYWAVIIAEILYSFVYSFGSQFVVKHRLKLVKKNVEEQWNFSKWVLLKGIVSYIKAAFDKVIVSRNFSVGELGLYNFSMESASTALQFVIIPLKSVLYSGLSEYIYDKPVLVDKVNKALLILSCIYLPIVFGGIYLSELLVPIIFGSQWIEAISMFDYFLAMTFAGMIVKVLTDVFTLTGKVQLQFYYETATSLLFLVIMYIVANGSLDDLVTCRILIPYLMAILMTLTLQRIIPIKLIRLGALFFIPAVSSTIMLVLLDLIQPLLMSYFNEVVVLIASIIIGACFYAIGLLSLIFVLKNKVNEIDFIYKSFCLPFFIRVKSKLNLS
ncbi:oligosaccharide flippase family protein [Vibrio sp. MA40-2]|uniref:oligosaccharide flippase family protein n=1 Tax=Vibrio sp. MA40-2 TaxID=3391828 RepID=UPI0039A66052